VDLQQFFTTARVLVVAGKGGVGKTTVSAVLARAAADAGLRVLVVELEEKTGIAGLLGGAGVLPYDEVLLAEGLGPDSTGEIRGRTITPSNALAEYLTTHGLKRLSKRLVSTGVIDVVSTAAPGIDDILVLGKLKQLEREVGPDGPLDLVVVDGPAAGHAITFLQSARSLLDAVRAGPINAQAGDVLEMLGDPERCQVLLVTLPEATPVNELVETAYALEDRVGVQLGPVVVNAVDQGDPLPEPAGVAALPAGDAGAALAAAARFRTERRAMHRAELERLGRLLPLPQLHLPLVPTAGLDAGDVVLLAEVLARRVEALPA
jgi:Mrp family chromosome partitioning ATPase